MILTLDRGSARDKPEGAPRIEHADCGAVIAGSVCEIGESRALRFWAEASEAAAVAAFVDGARQEVAAAPIRGGLRFGVTVPEGAREVTVVVDQGDARAELRLTLSAATATAGLSEAEERKRAGKLDAAEALLEGPSKDPRPAVRLQVLRARARIELARGLADRAARLFRASITEARAWPDLR